MKLKTAYIKRFEAFIQNSKDPNAEKEDDTKDNKKSKSVDPDDEDTEDTNEDDDPIEEMKRYFAKQEKNQSQLWKSSI